MELFEQTLPRNLAAGEKIFRSDCAQCHANIGAVHKQQGPNLNGLFGRQSGTTPEYSYCVANKNMSMNLEETIMDDYLINPKKDILDTKMVFPALKMPQERVDLIAYLK